jgi:hypothetical protein
MAGIKLSKTEIAALDLLIELKREEDEAAAVATEEEEGEDESVEAKAFPAVVAVGGVLARATPAAARVTARATPRARRAAKAVGRGAKKAAKGLGKAARDVGVGAAGGVGAYQANKRLGGRSLSEEAPQVEEELAEGLSLEELLEIRQQVEEE